MDAAKYSSCINQYLLERQLKLLFPKDQTYVDSKRQLKIKYPFSGKHLELDVWIPKKNVGFEFQDLYHYITTWYAQHTLDYIQHKDHIKKGSVQQMGITLIAVPCWWNGTYESLAATIYMERPDLLPNLNAIPISLNAPKDYFPKADVPDVGELMLASFPRDLDFDPTEIDHSWWMGEKYDGVRCCWNPLTARIYSRNGKKVPLHYSLSHHLPNVFLDGEIWFGRGMFSLAGMLFASSTCIVSWHALRMLFFDTPDGKLQRILFEKRYEYILNGLANDHPFSIVVPRILCKSSAHMNTFVEEIVEYGGEGVIVRKVGSHYLHGRNTSLIKLKTACADKEALVIGLDSDYVLLKTPSGETFTVPYEAVLIPTPSTGEVVTFSYELGLRRDLPTNPKICKLRSDLSWEDVVASYTSDARPLNNFSQVKVSSTNLSNTHESLYPANQKSGSQSTFVSVSAQPPSPGTWNDISNRRKIFENYASEIGFDPLIPTNWYSQQLEGIMSFTAVARVLYYHQNSASRALLDLFPDIGLNKHQLWPEQHTLTLHVKSKSIQIFEKYAKANGFDPLNPTAWFSQRKRKILANKGIARVVSLHYKGKVIKALTDLFPSLASIKLKWITRSKPDPWREEENRRKFFEKYAEESGFDPCDPDSWYTQSRDQILSAKGAMRVISYHGGKVSTALRDLFPDIGLDEEKFSWNKVERQRNLFKNYAKQQGFDHLNPDNWYRHRERVLSAKGAANAIQHHQYSLANTLVHLFPDIGLDKSKLRNGPVWPDRDTRKRFFINYATTNGFDPRDTDTWYSQSKVRICASKGGHMVDTFYKGNVPGALLDLFPDINLDITRFKWYNNNNTKLQQRNKNIANSM